MSRKTFVVGPSGVAGTPSVGTPALAFPLTTFQYRSTTTGG
nr:hypothetical protein [Actinoalloteichus caeruleus]